MMPRHSSVKHVEAVDAFGTIYVLGDVHGHFHHVIDIVQRDRPAAVIFLGDLECSRPLHEELASIRQLTDIWWIFGNHDTDDEKVFRNLFHSELADRNLHGRVVEVGGVRIAGLGGIFRGDVWYPPKQPEQLTYAAWVSAERKKTAQKHQLTKMDRCQLQAAPAATENFQNLSKEGRLRKHCSSIFYADYKRLSGERADVLVTHEAPSCHKYGFYEIDFLAQRLGVKAAFHGHHHDSLDYRRFDEKLKFRAYGVGFCGITDLQGRVISSGDFDDARTYRQQHPVEPN